MSLFWIFLLWLMLSPTQIQHELAVHNSFVVWNVGQGQWTTLITSDVCYHFDLGGERFPLKKIKQFCYKKRNELSISHWDMDHLSALKYLTKWPQVCRREDPLGSASSTKRQLLNRFKRCSPSDTPEMPIEKIFPKTQNPDQKQSNSLSKVLVVGNWLIPGDSTVNEEKIWVPNVPGHKIKGLVLGHHGSRTSTSELLIDALPNLQWIVASARWRRYKHPHPQVIFNLRKKKKRILRTEDWGNIHFLSKIFFPVDAVNSKSKSRAELLKPVQI